MTHKVHYGPNLPIVYRLIGPGAHNILLTLHTYIKYFTKFHSTLPI